MPISLLWAGRAYGTNTGNLYLKLSGEEEALEGTLRLNETGVGIVVYAVRGAFKDGRLSLTGTSQTQLEGYVFDDLSASGSLTSAGELRGEWETSIGSAGTFILFPHENVESAQSEASAPSLHTARWNFSAVGIDKDHLIQLAQQIQKMINMGEVIVSVTSGTEHVYPLRGFITHKFDAARAEVVRIHAQEPAAQG